MGAHEEEEEEEEEKEAATSSIFLLRSRRLHSESWTFFHEPFAFASCPRSTRILVFLALVVNSGLSSITRASWFNSGNMYMIRLSRLWKNPLRTWEAGHRSAHSWYLAPTCSVPVLPEEYRNIAGFWVMCFSIFFTVTCSVSASPEEYMHFFLVGDDFSIAYSACLARQWIHVRASVYKVFDEFHSYSIGF